LGSLLHAERLPLLWVLWSTYYDTWYSTNSSDVIQKCPWECTLDYSVPSTKWWCDVSHCVCYTYKSSEQSRTIISKYTRVLAGLYTKLYILPGTGSSHTSINKNYCTLILNSRPSLLIWTGPTSSFSSLVHTTWYQVVIYDCTRAYYVLKYFYSIDLLGHRFAINDQLHMVDSCTYWVNIFDKTLPSRCPPVVPLWQFGDPGERMPKVFLTFA